MSLLGKFLVRKKEEFVNPVSRATDMGLHPLVSSSMKKDLKLALSIIAGVVITGAVLGISAKLIIDKMSENGNKGIVIQNNNSNERVGKENEKFLAKSKDTTKLENVNIKNISEGNVNTEKINLKGQQNMSVGTNIVAETGAKTESQGFNLNKKAKVKELVAKAQMKEIEGDIPKAIILYKRALVLDPENVDILYKLALLSLKAGYYSNAIKYADKILEKKKDAIPAILIKGKAYEKQGMLEKAQAILEEAFFYYPHNKDLIETLGELYEKQGDYLTAQDYYKMLADLGYIEGYLGLARINEKIGNLKEAYKYYKKVYENPNISDDLRIKVGQKLIALEDEQNGL
jgi:tetratricopeptide (TPR) repeat protein